jgi:mono/diheme cytochrome c family protein
MKLVTLACVLACACDGGQPIHELDPSWSRMDRQRRADPYNASDVFANGAVMQKPPEGTREFGITPARAPLTREGIEHGRARFETFCAPCHGIAGDGESAVADRMSRRPPSYEDPRIAALTQSDIEEVIRTGYGLMPSYASKLDDEARRETAAYVVALRLSRRAVLSELPADVRADVVKEAP